MTDWTTAACIGHDTNLWFAHNSGQHANPMEAASAVRICGDCPILAACLASAMGRERGTGVDGRHGIYGGLTGSQRHAMDPSARPAKPLQQCGTPAAHARHERAGETCAVCLEADRAYNRETYAKAKARGYVRPCRAVA